MSRLVYDGGRTRAGDIVIGCPRRVAVHARIRSRSSDSRASGDAQPLRDSLMITDTAL
jgi:hypothetical protein